MAEDHNAERVKVVDVGGIQLAYESIGDRDRPPVLMIMGLATQMLGWPDEFCVMLADEGHHVVRFDNRDVGLSTHLHGAPRVRATRLLLNAASVAPYTLSDMAGDTVGLLDALGLESAHVVGASMGGSIGQTMAIEHPERVPSLTSIMSTTGNARVGRPTMKAMRALLARRPLERDAAIERVVANYRVIGSPGFEFDEVELRQHAGLAFDRAYDPQGVMRQLAAVWASGDRTPMLGAVRAPTLVLHGREDPLAPLRAGVATAKAIPGSELVVFDGMGHDLPRALWPDFVGHIRTLVSKAEAARVRG
ncbi:MAG: alpha/beta fold hydrolase [Thermoleophilaceae bacterium]